MGVGGDTWLGCMSGLDWISVDSAHSADVASLGPPYDCAVDPLLFTYPFDSTCKPTPTVWDETPTLSSWADQDTSHNASTVTASPYPFDTLTRARDQLSTYAPTCPATWTPCPDVVLTDLPPSSTSPYLGLDTAFETSSSPYVAPDDGGGLQANFRREVGSQAQTEASLKRRRALAPSSSTYTCDRCPKTFTRKKNLQDHLRRHDNRRDFACLVTGCSSRFNTNNDLQRHTKIVHARQHAQSL